MASTDYRKLSDEELVHRYASRNEELAFVALFQRYTHLVYGVCLKYLKNVDAAQDANQQIFIKLLEDLKRFEIEYFKAWLYKVARNHCYMLLRKINPEISQENFEENVEFEDEWHQKVQEEYFLKKLEEAVQELSKEQRVCIRHFYLDKMSYAEVARQTNYDLKQVKSAIQNGKRNLKIKLQGLLKKQTNE
ncbi:MAG: sigma-70 family RNA polymerase sigma factor [Chitinophagaceae bacterium]|nr:sigma-70 family RNA polymerase sigma factor [Chitinophagaceae bacterium]